MRAPRQMALTPDLVAQVHRVLGSKWTDSVATSTLMGLDQKGRHRTSKVDCEGGMTR